jgi:hypothetical protein
MRCAIVGLEWIDGKGTYACIAWCHVPTVTLHETENEAQKAKERIDRTACGSRCLRKHEVVQVVI